MTVKELYLAFFDWDESTTVILNVVQDNIVIKYGNVNCNKLCLNLPDLRVISFSINHLTVTTDKPEAYKSIINKYRGAIIL